MALLAMATQAALETQVGQETLAPLGILALQGLAEILALLAIQVALVRLAPLVTQARRGQVLQQGRLETPATLVLPVVQACLARLGQRHLSFL